MAMVGLPAIRRGSFVFVTRLSTVEPMGITVLPSTTIGSVTLAENGSPDFELKVASVVSSFILTAVPGGRAVCAHAKLAIRTSAVSESVFFMLPPEFNYASLAKRAGRFRKTFTTKGTKSHEGNPWAKTFVVLRVLGGSWFFCPIEKLTRSLLQSSKNPIQWRAVELVRAAIDIAHQAAAISVAAVIVATND